MTMTCPIHGGSLATPCNCTPTLNQRRVEEMLWPAAHLADDGCACGCTNGEHDGWFHAGENLDLRTLPNVPLEVRR